MTGNWRTGHGRVRILFSLGGENEERVATFAAAGIALIDANTMTVVLTLTAPFTVTAAAPSIVISFDVANTLNFTGAGADTCVIWFEPPAVAISIS